MFDKVLKSALGLEKKKRLYLSVKQPRTLFESLILSIFTKESVKLAR